MAIYFAEKFPPHSLTSNKKRQINNLWWKVKLANYKLFSWDLNLIYFESHRSQVPLKGDGLCQNISRSYGVGVTPAL